MGFAQRCAQQPLMVAAAYFGVYVLVTALSIPGAVIITVAGEAIFAFGWGLLLVSTASSRTVFARARCCDCGHDFLVAFSCKGRGICPSCNKRRMAKTATHLTDPVFPRLPVRQWVLSVPKRLRYFMQRDGAVLGMVLRIFLRVIE